MRNRTGRLTVVAIVFMAMAFWAGSAAAALGGPVIIGGDDLTDHGSVDTVTGDLEDGWLYLQRALENVSPKVVRANDGSVAALGSGPSDATSGNAGAAIGLASAKAGLTVTYYEGDAAISGFFASLAAGTANPQIIWIAGTGASNDLDSAEAAALTAAATGMADFVAAGGGLVSHGSEYGWLFALLPGLSDVSGGSSGDLYLTPEGIAAFPGVTNTNLNAGPWHNHFEGDFGGLQVLVRSSSVQDSNTGADAAVVLGGASVVLGPAPPPSTEIPPADIGVTKSDSPDPVSVGQNLTYTMEVTNFGPGPAPGATFGDTLPTGVTFVSVSTTKGTCSGGARVTCALGTLALGEKVKIVIVVRVNAAGTLVNTAEVATTVADHNVGNNQRSTVQTAAQGPFTPPTVPTPPVAAGCSLSTSSRSVPAGIASTIRVAAATSDGTPLDGVRIRISGAGVKSQAKLSGADGIASFRVIPKRGGAKIVVSGVSCGRALSVSAVRTASCTGLSVTPKSATVGAPLTLSVRLLIAGKPAIGVVVLARGVGLVASATTDSVGKARLSGVATSPGIVTITVPGILTCSKRIGVSGAFEPPQVTG